jgi:hypothetical protein
MICTDKTYLRKSARKEKKAAAFHEISHVAIVSKYGGYARASVWRNKSGDPDEVAWCGRCHILVAPGAVIFEDDAVPAFVRLPPPANWQVLVGLAGVVGEGLFVDGLDVESIAEQIDLDMFTGERLSATDLAMIGDQLIF